MNESENCGDVSIDSNLLDYIVHAYDNNMHKLDFIDKNVQSKCLNTTKSRVSNRNSINRKIEKTKNKKQLPNNEYNNSSSKIKKNSINEQIQYNKQRHDKSIFNNNFITNKANTNFSQAQLITPTNFINYNTVPYTNLEPKPDCRYYYHNNSNNNSGVLHNNYTDNMNMNLFRNNYTKSIPQSDNISNLNYNYKINDQNYLSMNNNQMSNNQNYLNYNNNHMKTVEQNNFSNYLPYNINNQIKNDNYDIYVNNKNCHANYPTSTNNFPTNLSYINSLYNINKLQFDIKIQNNNNEIKNFNKKIEHKSKDNDMKNDHKNIEKYKNNIKPYSKNLNDYITNTLNKQSNIRERKFSIEDFTEKQKLNENKELINSVHKTQLNSKVEVDLYLSSELKLIIKKFAENSKTSKSKVISKLIKYVFDHINVNHNYILNVKKSYIFYVCCTKKGSKFMQNLLPLLTTNDIKILFKKIEFFVEKLIYNQFGNFFIQKFLRVLESNERVQFIHSIESCIISLCEHKYGNHTLQLLFRTSSTNTTLRKEEEMLVISLLSPAFKELARQDYAVYVLEQIVEHFLDDTKFPLFKFISNSFYLLAEKDSGIKLLKKFIGYYKEHDKLNYVGKNNIVNKLNYDNENYYISPFYADNSYDFNGNLNDLYEKGIRKTFLNTIIKKFNKYALSPKTNLLILQILSCWKIETCGLLIDEVTKNFFTLLSSREGCFFLKKLYNSLDYVSINFTYNLIFFIYK